MALGVTLSTFFPLTQKVNAGGSGFGAPRPPGSDVTCCRQGQTNGVNTILSDEPRMELPDSPDGTPEIDLGLRKDRTLCYLDFTVNFSRGTSVRGSAAGHKEAQEEAACVAARPQSVDLWQRRLARCHEGILKSTANIKETGVVFKDHLPVSPCKILLLQKSTQKKHLKTTCQRVYTDLLGPAAPATDGRM